MLRILTSRFTYRRPKVLPRTATRMMTTPVIANCRPISNVACQQFTHSNRRPILPFKDEQIRFTITSGNYQSNRHSSSESVDKSKLTPKERIENMINSSKKRVFVFMKGVPDAPQCGYSNAVVQILDAYGVEYDSCNVLDDEEIRQEIKAYSNWPTIPQVYMDKTFVGGCDILIQMHQNKELEELFKTGKPK